MGAGGGEGEEGTGCKEISGGVRKAEPWEAVFGKGATQHVVSESDSLSLYASCFLLNCHFTPPPSPLTLTPPVLCYRYDYRAASQQITSYLSLFFFFFT